VRRCGGFGNRYHGGVDLIKGSNQDPEKEHRRSKKRKSEIKDIQIIKTERRV